MLLSTGDSHIQQAAFFFQFAHRIDTHRRWKDIFLQTDNKNSREFKSFCRVNRHQCHFGLFFITLAIQVGQQGYLLQKVAQLYFLFTTFLLPALHKILHSTQEFLQVLLSRQVLWIAGAVDILADTTLHDDSMAKHVSILLSNTVRPSFYQHLKCLQLGQRTTR